MTARRCTRCTWRACALFVVAAALALALVAEAAHAGVVSFEAGVLSYRSAPGDQDYLELVHTQGYVEVRGAPEPVAGAGCAAVTTLHPAGFTSTAVRCPIPSSAPAPRLDVHLGDKSDVFVARGVLRGDIHGGRGHDSIRGAGRLYGGPGSDSLAYRGPRHSVLRGGPGEDEMTANPPAGPARMYGGPGRDRLDGSSKADVLRGGPGTDSIKASRGPDDIDPGPGVDNAADARYGDGGADIFRARDGRFDLISCHRGRDTVVLDRFDFYDRSCERVRRRGAARSVLYGVGVYTKRHGNDTNELALAFTCPFDGPRVCDPSFRVRSRRGPVLNGFLSTRGLGIQERTWPLRPAVRHALTHWTRVVMQARDALGRPYRQTISCPDGPVEVSPPYEGEPFAASSPLSYSRCEPPLLGLYPWGL